MPDLRTTEHPVRSIDVEGGRRNTVTVYVDPPVSLLLLIDDYELLVNGESADLDALKAWFPDAKDARVRVTQDFGRYGHVVKAEFFG